MRKSVNAEKDASCKITGDGGLRRKKVRIYLFEIAGVRYRMAAYKSAEVKARDTLSLVPEPDNPHDPNAIAIYKGKWHIGYVPRAWNEGVGQLLRELGSSAVTCEVSEAKAGTAYVEIFLEGAWEPGKDAGSCPCVGRTWPTLPATSRR